MTPPASFGDLISTEQLNPRTRNIDLWSTRHILEAMNQEDQDVPRAVERAIHDIGRVMEAVVATFDQGGRLFYFGAGTSGRLGVLDASECPPTFGVPPEQVQGIIAGGDDALRHAIEGAEDDEEAGREEVRQLNIQPQDTVVGLSASGGAPYVLGAMDEVRREHGATTGCVTCVRDSVLAQAVALPIVVEVGPEVVAGSSRMKAGTAQKLVLNMITTGAMIAAGKTYQNLMVDVQPNNQKLKNRAERMVATIAEVSHHLAVETLKRTGYQVKPAIMILKKRVTYDDAQRLLVRANGKLRVALGED